MTRWMCKSFLHWSSGELLLDKKWKKVKCWKIQQPSKALFKTWYRLTIKKFCKSSHSEGSARILNDPYKKLCGRSPWTHHCGLTAECGWSVIFFWKIHYFLARQNLETNKSWNGNPNKTKNNREKRWLLVKS